jgi:beta-glucosidase
VGNCSNNTIIAAKIVLNELVITKQVKNIFSKIDLDELQIVVDKQIVKDVPKINLSASDFITLQMEEKYVEFPEVVKRLSNKQLATLNVGYHSEGGLSSVVGESCVSVPGGAGETPQLYKHLFGRTLSMADGPAGLRLSKEYVIEKNGKFTSLGGNNIVLEALDLLPKPISFIIKKLFFRKKVAKKGQEVHYQYCTALPIGTAIAQSWNKDFARMCGDIVGREMELYNVDLWLAPALNIQKSILCGRNFEYFSEDPLLSGIFASELTIGVQQHYGKGVTIKHFAANNQETNRYSNNSIISERVLREIYLRGFEYCIKNAQPKAVMSSYNLINGTHTSENRELNNDFLYNENNYQGIVMTDWVIHSMANKRDKYPYPRASRVALAGTSFMMPGSKKDVKDIVNELKYDKNLRKQVRINVTRVIKMIEEIE